MYHARTKHIKVHHHFIKEVLVGDNDLVYVDVERQVEENLTKVLRAKKLRHFHTMLGVHEMESSLRETVELSNMR